MAVSHLILRPALHAHTHIRFKLFQASIQLRQLGHVLLQFVQRSLGFHNHVRRSFTVDPRHCVHRRGAFNVLNLQNYRTSKMAYSCLSAPRKKNKKKKQLLTTLS